MRNLKLLILVLLLSNVLFAQRIKDIAYFKGVTSEQLIGYGLVVGLSGTGDSYRSTFTVQSVTSMLKRFGITVPETNLRTRNVAAVMVTAKVNNLAKQGTEFDVSVSSLGDAKSLMGGTLLMTPLSRNDGNVYAMSQGPVSIGGYDINTSSGGRVAKNHALSGRIPNGGILEKSILDEGFVPEELSIVLKEPDFTTSNAIADSINNAFGTQVATLVDGAEISLNIPAGGQTSLTEFLARVESIEVIKDVIAKVVLNERTGTVVAGSNVKISPVSISHGSLNITINSYPIISQPEPFSQGQTTVFNNLVPEVNEGEQEVSTYSLDGASNAQEVAAALNSLKVSPRDIIAIFQALKEAGALTAELIIM
ncbi:MAG: flagellar basal body P-ring protein FlgI [Ignavibacteriae bacterium]|nr:flagellar basal body P-ring protein FlgI [Ignavibacteriota bacterium]MCB0750553.1 flagellar basal body P-ring protein FlgI [Ignavibacteriota bacterium]MCB9206092.1 flagellar basal body P-ring protein FlgI [Ignavibacteriales bacterium]MCB9209365.1 flagellar basal body P-ring protein FlgI [Ignavibacteriales bacterium]MCB9258008.1 flagellar basal body P-ring protein FlgI [Ignavibacteriales bacterium]